jgi:phosphatidylglycerophosphatase A
VKPRVSPKVLRDAIGFGPWFSVTAGGLGHMWPASGTWGSLPPALLMVGLAWTPAPGWVHLLVQGVLAALASIACVRVGDRVEQVVGRKDPGVVVIDEVAGMALTLALALLGVAISSGGVQRLAEPMPVTLPLAVAAGGFFWFRVMDVIKPPPARRLQAVPGGLGVLIDDLVVAPYAALALLLSLEIFVRWVQPVGS